MSVLILNKISLSRINYASILHDLNEDMYLINDEASFPLEDQEPLSKIFKKIEMVRNYETSSLVECKAIQLHREVQFQRIIAVSECDIMRAARLRDYLKLEGQSYSSAVAFRDKLVMKDILRARSIRVPAARKIKEATDIFQFIDDYGFPIVIKPILGSGSVDTHIINDLAQLHAVLANGIAVAPESAFGMEVEEFIPGVMYHVDGFLRDGRLVAIWPSSYLNTCRDLIYGRMFGSYTLSPNNPLTPRLCAFVLNVLAALPTPPNASFHGEVFVTPEGQLVLCEIASRIGGPRIPDVWEQAFGVSLPDMFVRPLAGLNGPLPSQALLVQPRQLAGFLLIPPRAGVLAATAEQCPFPWVADYGLRGKVGHAYRNATDSNDFISSFVITGTSEHEMVERLQAAASWFDQVTTWHLN